MLSKIFVPFFLSSILNVNFSHGYLFGPKTTQKSSDFVTDPPDPRYQRFGGVVIQLTNKGLDFVTRTAEKAAGKLLRDFPIPNIEKDGNSVSNVKILSLQEPKIQASFKSNNGVAVNVTIPKLDLSADYKIATKIGPSGTLTAKIDGLNVGAIVRILKSPKGYPSIEIVACKSSAQNLNVVLSDKALSGPVADKIRSFVETHFLNTVTDLICRSVASTTVSLDAIFLKLDTPIPDLLSSVKNQPKKDLNMSIICGPKQGKKSTDKLAPLKAKIAEHVVEDIIDDWQGLSFDLKMNVDPRFSENDVIAGMRGDFAYNNIPSSIIPPDIQLPSTDRSMCFAVADSVPNSFLEQASKHGYLAFNETLTKDDMPPEIASKLKILCPQPDCKMIVDVSMSEAPHLTIKSQTGLRTTAKVLQHFSWQSGNKREKMIVGQANIDITVNLRVDGTTIKGTISMGPAPHIELHQVFVTGLANHIVTNLINKVVSRIIWPRTQKKLNDLLKKGIPMPAYCGLSFRDAQILNKDGFVVVCTNFDYNVEPFIARFIQWEKDEKTKKAATGTN